jgi:hypothetical protein
MKERIKIMIFKSIHTYTHAYIHTYVYTQLVLNPQYLLGILSISSIVNDDKEDKDENYGEVYIEDDNQDDYNLNHKELDLCQWFNKVHTCICTFVYAFPL